MPGGDWSVFQGDKVSVADLALTPDGATLVVTSSKGEVKIAEVEGRKVLHTLTAHKGAISACLISPDGKRFVTVGTDNVIKCWDLQKGTELRQWTTGSPAAGNIIGNIAFTPDSRQLVTANADTTLFVLDLP